MTNQIPVACLGKETMVSSVASPRLTAPRNVDVRSHGNDLDNLLHECIDETLSEVLGPRIKEAVYDRLVRGRSVPRSEVPEHLDDLFLLLEEILGRGSKTIGRVIARKLYSKLGWQFVATPKIGRAHV
jgi:hypothetical protein